MRRGLTARQAGRTDRRAGGPTPRGRAADDSRRGRRRRLASAADDPGRPVRMSSDDAPPTLLEQLAPLPPMTDERFGRTAGESPDGAATVAVALKPLGARSRPMRTIGRVTTCGRTALERRRAANTAGGGAGGSGATEVALDGHSRRGAGGGDRGARRLSAPRGPEPRRRGPEPRRHRRDRGRREGRPEMAGRQPGRRRPLGSAHPRRRQGDQRARPRSARRRQPRRHRHDRPGAAGLSRLRPHASRRPLPRGRSPRTGVSDATPRPPTAISAARPPPSSSCTATPWPPAP